MLISAFFNALLLYSLYLTTHGTDSLTSKSLCLTNAHRAIIPVRYTSPSLPMSDYKNTISYNLFSNQWLTKPFILKKLDELSSQMALEPETLLSAFNPYAVQGCSGEIHLIKYFDQTLGLLSYLIPFFFINPESNRKDVQSYLIFSTGLTLIFIPAGLCFGLALNKNEVLPEEAGLLLYIYGILGACTGYLVPSLFSTNRNGTSFIQQKKTCASILLGYTLSTLAASLISKYSRLTSPKTNFIFSGAGSGILTGMALSGVLAVNQKRKLAPILIGGWGGLIISSVIASKIPADRMLIRKPEINISFPAVITLPMIPLSRNFSRMEDISADLVLFTLRF